MTPDDARRQLALRQNLATQLGTLTAKAHELGLHVTGHALHRAVQAVGYEMAGEIEAAGKAARGEQP